MYLLFLLFVTTVVCRYELSVQYLVRNRSHSCVPAFTLAAAPAVHASPSLVPRCTFWNESLGMRLCFTTECVHWRYSWVCTCTQWNVFILYVDLVLVYVDSYTPTLWNVFINMLLQMSVDLEMYPHICV